MRAHCRGTPGLHRSTELTWPCVRVRKIQVRLRDRGFAGLALAARHAASAPRARRFPSGHGNEVAQCLSSTAEKQYACSLCSARNIVFPKRALPAGLCPYEESTTEGRKDMNEQSI